MLTPATPSRAIANSSSSIHSADANVSLTPRLPLHPTELSSSICIGSPAVTGDRGRRRRGCATKPVPANGVSRCWTVGNFGEVVLEKQRLSG